MCSKTFKLAKIYGGKDVAVQAATVRAESNDISNARCRPKKLAGVSTARPCCPLADNTLDILSISAFSHDWSESVADRKMGETGDGEGGRERDR